MTSTSALIPRAPATSKIANRGQITGGVLALMVILLFVAFVIRVYRLDFTDIEGDEAFSYVFSADSIESIVQTTLTIAEPHPVASYVIDHAWLILTGKSSFVFRYLSVLFGVACVAALYRLARRLTLNLHGNRQTIPVFASLFIALSPFAIEASRNGRMYSLSLLLSIVSTWLALEVLTRPVTSNSTVQTTFGRLVAGALSSQTVKPLIAYVLVSTLALNTHYFTGTILLAQNVFVLIIYVLTPKRANWQRILRWSTAQLTILIAFVPWYLLVRDILKIYPGASYFSPAADFMVRLMAGVYIVGFNAVSVRNGFALLAGVAMVIGIVRLVIAGKSQRMSAVMIMSILCVPFILSYLDSRGRSTFAERQVIATSAASYLLIAVAVAPVWEVNRTRIQKLALAVPPVLITAGICTGMAFGISGYFNAIDASPSSWKPFVKLVSTFSTNITPDQLRVAQNVPEPAMTIYYGDFPAAINIPARANDENGAINDVKALSDAGVERVILREDVNPWWNGGANKDIAMTALMTQFTIVNKVNTGRWWVYIFGRTNPSQLTPVGISYSNGLMLRAALTRPMTEMRTTVKGKVLEVHLQWDTSTMKRSGTEKIFIHVLDQNNQVPSQLDLAVSDADLQTPVKTYGVPISDDIKPGTYLIRIGLYDPAQPGAPRLRTSNNTDGIQIGTLSIEE